MKWKQISYLFSYHSSWHEGYLSVLQVRPGIILYAQPDIVVLSGIAGPGTGILNKKTDIKYSVAGFNINKTNNVRILNNTAWYSIVYKPDKEIVSTGQFIVFTQKRQTFATKWQWNALNAQNGRHNISEYPNTDLKKHPEILSVILRGNEKKCSDHYLPPGKTIKKQ